MSTWFVGLLHVGADLGHELRVGGVDRRAASPITGVGLHVGDRERVLGVAPAPSPEAAISAGLETSAGVDGDVEASVPVKKAPPWFPFRSNPSALCVFVLPISVEAIVFELRLVAGDGRVAHRDQALQLART